MVVTLHFNLAAGSALISFYFGNLRSVFMSLLSEVYRKWDFFDEKGYQHIISNVCEVKVAL